MYKVYYEEISETMKYEIDNESHYIIVDLKKNR